MSNVDGIPGGVMGEQPGKYARHIPEGARLVLASGNDHKVEEVRAILRATVSSFSDEQLVGLKDLGLPSPVEDGVTFEENSILKARAVVSAAGLPALADDSGLIVDVLGNAPGVFSARWAGGHGDDAANLNLLLDQLADVPDHYRGARFVCVATLVNTDGTVYTETGEVEGTLLRAAQGTGGFGYDPVFQPQGYARSMAELSADEKNSISHRRRAFELLQEEVSAVLAQPAR